MKSTLIAASKRLSMHVCVYALTVAVAACGGGSGDAALAAATGGAPVATSGATATALATSRQAAAADATTATDISGWTPCASENGYCSFSGTQQVAYGVTSTFTLLSLSGGTTCSNAVFGDPVFGTVKSCFIAPAAATTPGTGTGTGTWVLCAGENQTCSFSGTQLVRYGTATQNTSASFSGSVTCSNAVFGDPAFGIVKSCWYQDTSSTPTTPATPTAPTTPSAGAGASGSNPPLVFNASASGRAGDVVSLQGANFGSAPSVYFEGAPAAPLTIVNSAGGNQLSVQLPATAPSALILRVSNGTGISAQVKLNAARPLHLDALQLTPGGAFRVFGRNLYLAGSTPVVTVNGAAATLDLAHSDEYMLTATAPATLTASAAATVTVDNGNGTGPATLDRTIQTLASGSGDPFALGVGWAAGYTLLAKSTVNAATDTRLAQRVACNGSSDDAWPIQLAINLANANGGGVVQLPAGTCRLVGNFNLLSNVVVQGAGKTATVLKYDANYAFSALNIDLAGIRNLTLVNSGAAVEGPMMKNSTRVFLQNVGFTLNVSRQMYMSGNTHFVIQNCTFLQTGGINEQAPYTLTGSAGLVFENNTTQWVVGAPTFQLVHDSYLHANHFTRDGSGQNLSGTVHSMTLDFDYRVAVVGNTFDVVNGPITNHTRNDGESILTEGGGAQRTENLGHVVSADGTSISDPANTIVTDPFGTGSILENYGVAIVGGTGAGQVRRLVSYSQPKMTVDRAWDQVPDSTSTYATFVWGLEKSVIKDNTFAQNPRGIWLYQTAIRDTDVINNSMSQGGGIYLRSYQNLSNKLFMPIYNVLVARNTVINTTGNWGSYINAVFVNSDANAFGMAMLGVEMRSNKVTANVPNTNLNGEEYAGVEGIMNMMRVENFSGYQSSTLPRLLGTIVANNACTNCAVAVRVGTGAGGTTILNQQFVGGGQLLDDWATTVTSEKSVGTVVR